MKIVINTFSQNVSYNLGIEFIPMGIEGIEINSRNEALQILKSDASIPLLITDNYQNDFIEEARNINPAINIFLIINHSIKPNDLKELANKGIKALISYSENPSIMAEDIVKNIINNNIKASERRSQIRIKPKNHERIAAAVYIKNLKKFISGLVLDISAGGVAIKFQDSLEASLLVPKMVYDPLVISLYGSRIRTLSTLVAKREDTAGFKFDNIEPGNMKIISAYIYKRISDDSHELITNLN